MSVDEANLISDILWLVAIVLLFVCWFLTRPGEEPRDAR